jgi:thiol-disulfide isomerase/thioredoxin
MLNIPRYLQTSIAIAMTIGAISTTIGSAQADPLNPTPVGATADPATESAQQENQQPIPAPQTTTNSTIKLPVKSREKVSLGAKIETASGPAEIALAEYLAKSNVKFYGAYWCAHCQQQKSLFGAVAASKLPYIECAEGGENSQRQLCKEKNIQMFPTWAIKGKFIPGTLDLKKIAELTGYKGLKNFKYQK